MSYEPFLGEIKIFGFQFSPLGHLKCDGSLLSINENTALFSLIQNRFGGDGINTFALPDLRGRTPINQGQGNGLSRYSIGQYGGMSQVHLSINNLPAHNHTMNSSKLTLNASSGIGEETNPQDNHFASNSMAIYTGSGGSPNVFIQGMQITGNTDVYGSSAPFDIQTPFLAVNYCIATEGIYPSRP